MGRGWGGSLKYPLPPMKFLLKATLPPPKILLSKILEKNGIFEEIFDFFG
jgi:hypothetical protein